MPVFKKFCEIVEKEKQSKLIQATQFIYFHLKTTEIGEIDIATVNSYFRKADLPLYNVTFLKKDFSSCKKVTKGSKYGWYKLTRQTITEYDKLYSHIFEIVPIKITEHANIIQTPYLNEEDIKNAHKMAELYIILHCYENSVRRFVEDILGNTLGKDWFTKAASSDMTKKVDDRIAKEQKNKWMSPRGTSPLFYLDWTDLAKIIRKYPTEFSNKIPDIGFIELRLGELERTRNIVAHNGVLPSEEDFQTLILYFKHWCKQIGK